MDMAHCGKGCVACKWLLNIGEAKRLLELKLSTYFLTLQVKWEVIEKNSQDASDGRFQSYFSVSKCCMLYGQSLRGNVKYSFSEILFQWRTDSVKYSFREVLIQWSTHSVNYSFSEVLIQWSTHSVKYSFSEVLIQWSTHSVKYPFS